jgi:hypothetical protein
MAAAPTASLIVGCGASTVALNLLDAGVDSPAPDASADSVAVDAGVDSAAAEASADVVAVDANVDSAAEGGVYLDASADLEVPLNHRPVAIACPQARAPETTVPVCVDGGPNSIFCSTNPCAVDSDCDAGTNGRCAPECCAAFELMCSYDECFDDSDCQGGPCQCRDSSSNNDPNLCFTAGNCTVDADCGPGGYCSPSMVDFGNFPGDDFFCWCPAGGGSWPGVCPAGYYCHTPGDTCVNDSDCSNVPCVYDIVNHIWDCQVFYCPG